MTIEAVTREEYVRQLMTSLTKAAWEEHKNGRSDALYRKAANAIHELWKAPKEKNE
jgi:hypothetical protein